MGIPLAGFVKFRRVRKDGSAVRSTNQYEAQSGGKISGDFNVADRLSCHAAWNDTLIIRALKDLIDTVSMHFLAFSKSLICVSLMEMVQFIERHKKQLPHLVKSVQYLVRSGQYLVRSGQYLVRSGQYLVRSGQYLVGSGQYLVGSGQYLVGSGQYLVGSGQYLESSVSSQIRSVSRELGI